MNTEGPAASPQAVDPNRLLDMLFASFRDFLSTPADFCRNIIEGTFDTLRLIGHTVQIAETALINAAGDMLEQAFATAEPALDVLLEWADGHTDPMIGTIRDNITDAIEFILGRIGIEFRALSAFGC